MGRLRGFLWLIAGVVVAALAGGVAFIALSRATTEGSRVTQVLAPEEDVVVVARTIDIHQVLTAENVAVKRMAVDAIPEGAIRDLDQVLGKITMVPLYPGEFVMPQRLLDPNVRPPDGRTALVLAEDNVLMAFPAGDLINQVNVLQSGDHVDFLFTYEMPVDRATGFLPVAPTENVVGPVEEEEEETETLTFNLLQNVTIAQVVRQLNEDGQPVGPPRALLLTITPQDALVLKYMKDVGAVVDLVLRAPGAEGRFEVEPVDLDYIINGYIVPGEGLP
jgi:pilus assembly protein CpaB